MVNDLINLGVKYNKSKILEFPTSIQVPENLIRHFIRGYFDGDGSVHRSSTSCSVSFVGTEMFLNDLLKEFKKFLSTETKLYKYKNKDIYEVKVGGKNQLKNIYKYFYEDATIFLGRKKNRFEEILN